MAAARPNQNRLTTAATSTPRRLDTAVHQKDRQDRFLATFAVCGSAVHACRAAGIHRQSHYYWLHEDPTYATRFERARQRAVQTLEDMAVLRAVEGVRRPVMHHGRQVTVFEDGVRKPLWEQKYSDGLLVFLLKAWAPEKYAHARETINLLELDPDTLSAAQLDKLLEHLIVKMAGPDPEAQEAARRDLAAAPAPMGTPASRVKEAGEQLQAILRRYDAAMADNRPEVNDLVLLMADVRRVVDMFAAPATAIEAKSEEP